MNTKLGTTQGQLGSGHYPSGLQHVFNTPVTQSNHCMICKQDKSTTRSMWISAGHLSRTGMFISLTYQCEDCTPQGHNAQIDNDSLQYLGINPNSLKAKLAKQGICLSLSEPIIPLSIVMFFGIVIGIIVVLFLE